MTEYNKVDVKSSDSQLSKSKAAVKNQTGTLLRVNIKMLEGFFFLTDSLPHKLLLTTRQKTKLSNAFNQNMAADISGAII